MEMSYVCTEGFGEASVWLTHETLKEVQYRPWEIEFTSSLYDLELVRSERVIQHRSRVCWRQGIEPSHQQLWTSE